MIIGRNLFEDQKLYSTGDDYVDELLERAFCEGYEYAQREFTYMNAAGQIFRNNGTRIIPKGSLIQKSKPMIDPSLKKATKSGYISRAAKINPSLKKATNNNVSTTLGNNIKPVYNLV